LADLKGSQEKDDFFELETGDIDCIKEASQVCPVQVIVIEE
jgi:ferredoxin